MKLEGVRAGVWDLFIGRPIGPWHGMYIETKWGDNGLSKNQIDFWEEFKNDYYFDIYRSISQLHDILIGYLNQK